MTTEVTPQTETNNPLVTTQAPRKRGIMPAVSTSFQSLIRGNRFKSLLGYESTTTPKPQVDISGSFIEICLDFANSDEKEVAAFEAGKTATIKLSGEVAPRGCAAVWSPTPSAVHELSGIPAMHILLPGDASLSTVRVRKYSKDWSGDLCVARVALFN